MTDLSRTKQRGDGSQTGRTERGEPGDEDRGAQFGTAEEATRGTDRDADASGESRNQGHGDPREERDG